MNARARGLAVVEFAMVLPFMLLLLFGVVDLGRMVLTRQILINVSREASNLTSRGTLPSDAIAAVQISAQPLNFPVEGFVIISEVARSSAGALTVKSRASGGGRPQPSRIGASVGGSATLPVTSTPIPPNGQSVFVTEVYYHSPPVTPLGSLIGQTIGDIFYDVAFF
ncbi:MAG TPA: TadE/TadG family type IV pilus assembly protein [Nevskiaceae bacterium]|nr:TadE/TadG family type IV pilus assembly protein [Nevskiaceae bacterium]